MNLHDFCYDHNGIAKKYLVCDCLLKLASPKAALTGEVVYAYDGKGFSLTMFVSEDKVRLHLDILHDEDRYEVTGTTLSAAEWALKELITDKFYFLKKFLINP